MIGLLIFVYQLIVLGNPGLKKYIQLYLVKKNGLVSKVSSFFVSGVIYLTCIYIIVTGCLYFLCARGFGSAMIFSGIWNALLPIISAMVMAVLMVLISILTVKTKYSSKNIQAWKELERKKQEELKRQQS